MQKTNEPLVTININTDGRCPHLLEEALWCALNQTYKNIRVQIVCTHPDGVRLETPDERVRILNIAPFPRFPFQLLWSVEQITEGLWCTLDSDDLIFPNHVETLVNAALPVIEQKNLWDKGGWCIKGVRVMTAIGNTPLQIYTPAWVRCLYTALTEEQRSTLRRAVEKYSFSSVFDARINHTYRQYRGVMGDVQPTYVYRLGLSYHVSRAYLRNPAAVIPEHLPPLRAVLRADLDNIRHIYSTYCEGREGWSLDKLEWVCLLKWIRRTGVSRVCEFGSGLTTVLLDSIGKLAVSYETLPEWKAHTEGWMQKTGAVQLWDGVNVPDLSGYDAVFIDGPRGAANRRPVYEAVGQRGPRIVIAHDARREGDKQYIEKYLFPTYVRVKLRGQMMLLRRRRAK